MKSESGVAAWNWAVRVKFAAVMAPLLLLAATQAAAAPALHPQAEAQALDLAKKSIALRSVHGPRNQTPEVAALFRSVLVAGGFAADDVTITPVDDTAYLVARWPGSNPGLKPLVISGHMDVVDARPEDWDRDPFTPVIENGFLYGRGASDMKLDAALTIASLIQLKRQGYKPRRTIILEFSGDEESVMKTSAIIAEKFADAEFVINVDGGNGVLDEKTGKPAYFSWQGAEKTYADFEITVTNPGGHSSLPRPDNAIVQLSDALGRIGRYQFKPELNDLTRAYFLSAAKLKSPDVGAAMRAFAADPTDRAAIDVLSIDPVTAAQIKTTCVPTLVSGGHATNALPQRATANINCRIFPGHKPSEILAELQVIADEPVATFKDVTEGSVANDASPLRPDVSAAINKAVASIYPGVPVFPEHGKRRERQHVVPLPPCAELCRQPGLLQDLGRFQPRP